MTSAVGPMAWRDQARATRAAPAPAYVPQPYTAQFFLPTGPAVTTVESSKPPADTNGDGWTDRNEFAAAAAAERAVAAAPAAPPFPWWILLLCLAALWEAS